MAVQRLQVNTGGTNVADYCLKNHVAAMGWSLRELTQAERSGIHTFLDYCNSDTNESEMILGNKIAAYGDAKRYIDSFRKDDYAFFIPKEEELLQLDRQLQTHQRKWVMKNIIVSE